MKRVLSVYAVASLAMAVLCTRAVGAQEWNWHAVDRSPEHGPVNAKSHVVLSPRDLVMTYSVNVDNRDIPITSCRVGLNDIANVHAVNNSGKPFLFVVLKRGRSATCNSGKQPVALVPVAQNSAAGAAVAAITRACCRVTVAAAPAAKPTVKPALEPPPKPTPAASPAAVPPADWVENEGLFAFVRVRNRDNGPITITGGQILNCGNVAYGCRRFAERRLVLNPGAVATLATVMSSDPGDTATFSYRYNGQSRTGRFTESGLSRKSASGAQPMSAQEIRSAEALAIAGTRLLKATGTPGPPAFVAAKLTRRGSSRLAIGQKGMAIVRVKVGANGMPQDASIVSISNRALVAAALETAVSSTYAPAERGGRPVEGKYVATFQFDGADPALAAVPVWRRSPTPSPVPSVSPSPSR